MTAPEIFGIALKEHTVELLAETVDIEILQGFFGAFVDHRCKVGITDLHGGQKAHIGNGLEFQRDRIIKKLTLKEDT